MTVVISTVGGVCRTVVISTVGGVCRTVVISTVGGVCRTVPLHEVFLRSQFVTGNVILGVIPTSPFDSVDILMGNDLTTTCCKNSCQVLKIEDKPVDKNVDVVQGKMIYPACVTTRSMSTQKPVPPVELNNTFMNHDTAHSSAERDTGVAIEPTMLRKASDDDAGVTFEDLPRLPWDRASLIAAQQADRSLDSIRGKIIDLNNVVSENECYFIRQEILMRKTNGLLDDSEREIDHCKIVVPVSYRYTLSSQMSEINVLMSNKCSSTLVVRTTSGCSQTLYPKQEGGGVKIK